MRYLVGIILIVVLVIFSVIFFSGGGKNDHKKPVTAAKILPDYANTDAEIQLTIDGTINSEQLHRSIIINVSRSTNTLQVVQGYQHNVIDTKTFDTNQEAFSKFLFALYRSSFSRSRKTIQPDERGVCPLGNRYIYELKNTPDHKDTRRWSTSCGGSGTFGGPPSLVRQIIELQIPNYPNLVSKVVLSAQ